MKQPGVNLLVSLKMLPFTSELILRDVQASKQTQVLSPQTAMKALQTKATIGPAEKIIYVYPAGIFLHDGSCPIRKGGKISVPDFS